MCVCVHIHMCIHMKFLPLPICIRKGKMVEVAGQRELPACRKVHCKVIVIESLGSVWAFLPHSLHQPHSEALELLPALSFLWLPQFNFNIAEPHYFLDYLLFSFVFLKSWTQKA